MKKQITLFLLLLVTITASAQYPEKFNYGIQLSGTTEHYNPTRIPVMDINGLINSWSAVSELVTVKALTATIAPTTNSWYQFGLNQHNSFWFDTSNTEHNLHFYDWNNLYWVQLAKITDVPTTTELNASYVNTVGDTMTGDLNMGQNGIYLTNGVCLEFDQFGGETGLFDLSEDKNIAVKNYQTDNYEYGGSPGVAAITINGTTDRVGLGVDNPIEKLEVNGNVLAEKYKSNSDISTTTTSFHASNTTGGNLSYTVSNNRLIITGSFVSAVDGDAVITATPLPINARPNITRYVYIIGGVNLQKLTINTAGTIESYLKKGETYIVDSEITLDLTQI